LLEKASAEKDCIDLIGFIENLSIFKLKRNKRVILFQ